jgi:choline-sulfatase
LERWGPEPYLLVADFNNPHDICLWIGDHAGPHTDEPVPGRLPPLPPNFDTDDLARRPLVIREAARRNPRVAQTQGWTEANFRYYLAAFYHYVEMLDREVGCVLNAWSRRPDAANTVVILTVDHGEAMAAHRMVTKSWHFYEEVVRVPLIFAGPGIAGEGRAIGGSLASLLDVFPTLCDLAAIAPPPGLRGRSLGPALAGSTEPAGPDCVVSTYGAAQLDSGAARMVRTARFKYTHFNEDGGEELFDLENDPGEQRSLVEHPDWAAELAVHRARLQRHCAATGDPYPMQAAPAFAQGPEDGGVPGGAARGPDRRVLRARGVKAC